MTEFRARVTLQTAIALVALAVPAAWLAGPTAAIGVLAAGTLATANFWWLSRSATAASASGTEVSGWVFTTGIRFTLLFAAFAALCAGGYAHPVAVVLGLSVLPCVLVIQGMRDAAAATADADSTAPPGPSGLPGGGRRGGAAVAPPDIS